MPTPAPTQISMCNVALDLIRSSPIQDINENSLQASKCRVHYPLVISNMLEMHDWSFVNQRVQMAQAGTNARPYEWLYAYLLPSNCGQPNCVLPDPSTLGLALPAGISGDVFYDACATVRLYEVPYIIEAGILYCNAENAWLDYTINAIDGVLISSLCSDAVSTDLASRLAVPVKGDSTREKELLTKREVDWQKAIAGDNNRQPQEWGDYDAESILARHLDHDYPGCW